MGLGKEHNISKTSTSRQIKDGNCFVASYYKASVNILTPHNVTIATGSKQAIVKNALIATGTVKIEYYEAPTVSGGGASDKAEWILKPNTTYCIRVIVANDDTDIFIDTEICEI